jgi:hypothetical protein
MSLCGRERETWKEREGGKRERGKRERERETREVVISRCFFFRRGKGFFIVFLGVNLEFLNKEISRGIGG